jgi:hypothetical protein
MNKEVEILKIGSIMPIIDGCILITKKSVYAIHNLSDVREKKLGDLGL